jgi:hypothetical protein
MSKLDADASGIEARHALLQSPSLVVLRSRLEELAHERVTVRQGFDRRDEVAAPARHDVQGAVGHESAIDLSRLAGEAGRERGAEKGAQDLSTDPCGGLSVRFGI